MWEDTISWGMDFFRQSAEELMVDHWRVFRLDLTRVDDLTGEAVRVTVYDGKGKLQSNESSEQNPESVGHTATIQRMTLHLPVGDYQPLVGDVAVCVESVDQGLVDTECRVTQNVPTKTFATAYRIPVEFEAA